MAKHAVLLLRRPEIGGCYAEIGGRLRCRAAVPAAFGQRLVFTSRSYTALVRSYGLKHEFITPHCPEQNGLMERVIRTFKEQCAHQHRFETLQHTSRVIGDWITFYNQRRTHQALGMATPAETYQLTL